MALLLACGPSAPEGPPPADLWRSMVQVDRPIQPLPYTPWMASSTDPRSTTPEAPDWFANDDRGHVLRHDADGYVLVDRAGPGMLVSLWSANPERGGTLTVEVDGRPALVGPMADLLAGRGAVPEPFALLQGGGSTLRLPIPYRHRLVLRMSEDRGKGVYWIAEGLDGDPGVRGLNASDPGDPALAEVAGSLVPPRAEPPDAPEQIVEPGGHAEVRVDGPAVVDGLAVTASSTEGLWLVGDVDGVRSVEAPLALFFGVGPGSGADRWRAVVKEPVWTGVSRFPIPAATSVVLAVENRSAEPRTVRVHATSHPGGVGPDTLRFRASHRAEVLVGKPWRDWTLADWRGRGSWSPRP
ncbi:MAG: DUF2961 domain-containing protein [Alphaproteobacteria bacterium]|nr:DUF2961 domain-containing protein [Alphaproteobacteria bacterium]